MKFKATVLCENYVIGNTGVIAEHGWSIFFETNHGNFLFDTGQGKAIINNARIFNIDLSSVKAIMLSHHHFDHTGGLLDALSVTGQVDVYAHPELFKESYSVRENDKKRYIGIPFARPILESYGAKFKFNTTWQEILPGIYLTGEIPRITEFENGDKNLVIQKGNQFEQDPIMDDQALVIKTEKGLYLILGCAHSGIINTLNYVIEKTGEDHFCAIVGGTHLGSVSKEQLHKSVEALKKYDIDSIGVSHCTGLNASMILAREFKEKFFFCNVGTVIQSK